MEELFTNSLPGTLYMTHYDLQMMFPEHSADEWRRYLKTKEKFIMREVSAMTEANARQALSKLSTGKLTAQEVAAIRQLLERSEQINQSDRDQRTFVMLQFDATPIHDNYLTKEGREKLVQANHRNVDELYGTRHWTHQERREFAEDTNRRRNADGTLHFPNTQLMSELDKAYVRVFNPDNENRPNLPEVTAPEEEDVQ